MVEANGEFAIEFQIHYRVAAVIAHMCAKAKYPTLAIHIPQPGAIYFGANNYTAGLMARVLGAFARNKRRARVSRVLLLDTSAAGPIPHNPVFGALRGIRNTLGRDADDRLKVVHRDAKDTEINGCEATTPALWQHSPREHFLVATQADGAAPGALRAVREAARNRSTAIVSQNFGPDPRVSAEIQDDHSPLIGSLACFPEKYGSKIIPAVLRWLTKKQVPPAFYTNHAMVTKENVKEFCPVKDSQLGSQDARLR